MPFNKDAFLRYLAIDAKLRLPGYPTLIDLKNFVEEKLGHEVSLRTIQLDIQEMRYNQGLGFEAPIVAVKGIPAYQGQSSGRLQSVRSVVRNNIAQPTKQNSNQTYYKYQDEEYTLCRKLIHISETFFKPVAA